MNAPKGSCALLREGRAKSCSDQKLQITAAALSGTGKRRASFLNFSRSTTTTKKSAQKGSKTKVPGESKEDPPPTQGDMRSAVRWIFLILLGLMIQGTMSLLLVSSPYTCVNTVFNYGPRILRTPWSSAAYSQSAL